jgi:hypothetical protein
MARAPDLVTYIDETSDPLLVSQAEAILRSKDTVLYSSTPKSTVFNAPGGSDTNIQFNSFGSFGGDGAFTFNTTTKAVNLTGNLNVGGLINGKFYTNFANFKISGGDNGQVISTNGNGTLSWRTVISDLPSDWNATIGTQAILNKPAIPSIVGLASESYVTTAINTITANVPTEFNTLKKIADELIAIASQIAINSADGGDASTQYTTILDGGNS